VHGDISDGVGEVTCVTWYVWKKQRLIYTLSNTLCHTYIHMHTIHKQNTQNIQAHICITNTYTQCHTY